jgi:hypothetical protein
MSTWVDTNDPLLSELRQLDLALIPFTERRDSAAAFLHELPNHYNPEAIATPGDARRAWEIVGLLHLNTGRIHEALAIFWALYMQMLRAQDASGYVHKGLPLVWIADCFSRIGFPAHAKRYLMLTLCEDAIRENGVVSPDNTGIYFRLVWAAGLPDSELRRYSRRFFELSNERPQEKPFPEALLQHIDQAWQTEYPSAAEASYYLVNPRYVRHLLTQLGTGAGESLELLTDYLMSCMPGCRTTRRQRSGSTDYDVVCSVEGFDVDFRSELGRYFVCECKDWGTPADFTAMAKFCRVLDSTKSRFGILVSRSGISGTGRSMHAEREQLKVFQDRGMVIVVLDENDLDRVASGGNLIQILRERYESIRLDLRGGAGQTPR